jgi:A/G-specific adenine glycosylase
MDRRALPLNSANLRRFRTALLSWYDQHGRDLPWRRDRDPYRVWVSEIMLQQTRVVAVLDHYARFMNRFPTVESLAAARETSVLAIWSGLGYYQRARRMHRAAKVIAREQGGNFPRTPEAWAELAGIGRYTAAAIASIAFGEAVAVVDGNVARVVERLLGLPMGREAVWTKAEALLEPERPGDFNQAMMELGATVCTPRAPQCLLCPVHGFCQSRGAEAARPQSPRKRKQLGYVLARKNSAILFVQRPADASLMAGMWELPAVLPSQVKGDGPWARLRHSITDTDYQVSVFAVSPDELHIFETDGRWLTRRQWERMPLTGLTRKVLRRSQLEPKANVAGPSRLLKKSDKQIPRRLEPPRNGKLKDLLRRD